MGWWAGLRERRKARREALQGRYPSRMLRGWEQDAERGAEQLRRRSRLAEIARQAHGYPHDDCEVCREIDSLAS